MKKVVEVGWDWKHLVTAEDLRDSLAQLGVFVYDNPMYEGSDAVGLLFSDYELTQEELDNIKEYCFDNYDEPNFFKVYKNGKVVGKRA